MTRHALFSLLGGHNITTQIQTQKRTQIQMRKRTQIQTEKRTQKQTHKRTHMQTEISNVTSSFFLITILIQIVRIFSE